MLNPDACITTARCRVPSAQQAFAPLSQIRIHLVLDYERLFSELSGSWLQASLFDGILDCGRPLVLDRGFAPLAGTDRNASEMFFTMLVPETFERQDHRHRAVNLVPCGAKADHLFANSHFGLGLVIKWRDGGGESPRTLDEAFAAASADAPPGGSGGGSGAESGGCVSMSIFSPPGARSAMLRASFNTR